MSNNSLAIVALTTNGAMKHHLDGWRNISSLSDKKDRITLYDISSVKNKERSSIVHFFSKWSFLYNIINDKKNKYFFFINGEYNPMLTLFLLLLRVRRKKVFITWHDVIHHPGSLSNLLYWLISFVNVGLASGLIVHNTKYLTFNWLKKINQVLGYSSLPVPEYFYPREGEVLSNKSNTILFFGRIEEYKGLRAVVDCLSNAETLLKLLIIGKGDKTLIKYIKNKANHKNIEYKDVFLKEEELALLIKKSKGVLMPYSQCSQSIVPDIVSSFGVPLIVSRQVEDAMSVVRNNNAIEFKDCNDLIGLFNNESLANTKFNFNAKSKLAVIDLIMT
jgi:glycosyltransferase involved in cell wall biosynthesis